MLDRVLRLTTAPAWFFLLLFAVYTATANYGGTVVNDVHSAAHAAWSLATRGTLDLSGVDLPYEQAWLVEVGDARYSNRFPGVILAAVPMYWAFHPDLPQVAPSALTAALASAVGVTAVLLGLLRQVPLRWAWASATLLALGSGVWSVAADALWTHGVTTMWLGLTYLGLARGGRWQWLVVVAAAGAVLTRPHLAIGLGVAALLMVRSRRTAALTLVAGTGLGALAYLVYVRLLLGEWSVTGTYPADALSPTRIGETNPEDHPGPVLWRLENTAMAFVSPRVGLLLAYPALLPALWAARRLRTVPAHVLALAGGGVAYLLVSVFITRVSGGSGFWGNRTLIETVVLAWPLLTVLVSRHRGGRVWRAALAVGAAWSVFFHGLGAVTPTPAPAGEGSTIMYWQVPAGVAASQWWQVLLVAALALWTGWAAWRLTRSPEAAPAPPPPRSGTDAELVAQPASTSASTSDATATSESSTSR